MGRQAWCPHSSVLLALPTALLRLLEPLDVSAGVPSLSSGRGGVWEAQVAAAQPPPRAGPTGLVLGFSGNPDQRAGPLWGSRTQPGAEQPRAGGGLPAPEPGPELRELHRRRRYRTRGAGSECSGRSAGCELFLRMAPHTAFRDPPPDPGGGRPARAPRVVCGPLPVLRSWAGRGG